MTPTIERKPLEIKKILGTIINPVMNTVAAQKTMKALVYGGPGFIELKDVPVPVILHPTDALVRIVKTTTKILIA